MDSNDKAKPAERQGRKATGPRFLREATDDSPKDPKIAGLPIRSSAVLEGTLNVFLDGPHAPDVPLVGTDVLDTFTGIFDRAKNRSC